MAFADPTPVTIGGVAKNLVRIDSGKGQSEYRLVEATQSFQMFIRSQELKVEADGRRKWRHNISLRQTVFATSTTPEYVRDASATLTHYSTDDITAVDDTLIAVAGMCTAANIAKLNNFES
jgi:hypothetical protein